MSTRLRGQRGQATVEFALVLPILLLLVVGLLQFGRGLYYWISANHLANEAARWAAVDRAPGAVAQATRLQQYVCTQAATDEMQNGMKVTVQFDQGSGFDQSTTGLETGDAVRVKVEKQFNIGFWDLLPGALTLKGSSVMRVERLAGAGGTSLSTYAGNNTPYTCT